MFLPRRLFIAPCLSFAAVHPTRNFSFSLSRKFSNCKINSTATAEDENAYFKYVPIEDVEMIERYCPGGYHPIVIGDRLHSRYHVVHKLGFGSYSTIWLAKDEQTGRYVALTISIADGNSQEYNILQQLGSRHAIMPPMLDDFAIEGPNGKHQCVVTTPARMSLSDAKEASNAMLFQLPAARAIVAQLIQGVAFLHSQRIVHSDLHLGNILLRFPQSLDNLSPDQFYAQYGNPRYEPVERIDNQPLPAGVPTHGLVPVWLGKGSEHISLSESSILLTDFGESFSPSTTTRHYSNTPAILAPPELQFSPETPLSFPADIWSLACTIYGIIGTRPPFEGFIPDADSITKQHVAALGQLPSEWWERWDARSKWLNKDGTPWNHYALGPRWEERFEVFVQKPRRKNNMEEFGNEEKAALFAMLKGMLAFRPRERLTAKKALESKWMKEWALPEFERLRALSTS